MDWDSKYEINAVSGCWEWQKYIDRNGYARVYDPTRAKGTRTQWAHRVYYERAKGQIPDRHEIDHVCQNTRCVNPDHLEAVTHAEHVARTLRRAGVFDRQQRAAQLRSLGLKYSEIAEALQLAGRDAAHEVVRAAIRNGLVDPNDLPNQTRLTEQERDDIRDLFMLGVPQTELAAWYRVDSSFVSRICNHLDTKQKRRDRGQVA